MKLSEHKTFVFWAGVALLSWILLNFNDLNEIIRSTPMAHSPDYFSNGYNKWEMNEDGLPNSQLFADKIIHYSDDRETHLDNPVYVSFTEKSVKTASKSPPWIIRAESGLLSADTKHLQLKGHVIIDKAKGPGVRAVQIRTTNLKVELDTRNAETDQAAELISAANRTTGIGMKFAFKSPVRLQLLSHVKGKYEK